MINSGSGGTNTNTTPKRDKSKRSSTEYMRAMATPSTTSGTRVNDGGSPETPSPPYNARRSSTSLGFLTSPLHPRAEAILSKNEFSSPSGDGGGGLMPASPGMPSRSRLMPPTTPKSRNAEVFLSPPPKLKSPSVYKDNGKPIREISNSLKARLNYALVKLQNGWVDKTLPELENELDEPMSSSSQGQTQQRIHGQRPGYRGSYHNEYATDGQDSYLSSHSEEEGDNGNSAHSAFLKALSSPKNKKNNREVPPASPLHWSARGERHNSQSPSKQNKPQPPQLPPLKVPQQRPNRQQPGKKQPPSEVEAIETLMSLSSPQRSHAPQEFPLSLPSSSKRESHNGRPSSPTSSSSSSVQSNSERLSNSIIPTQHQDQGQMHGQNRLVRPLIVPSLQRPASGSDLSGDSGGSDRSSSSGSGRNYLQYSQQQTDIETDVENSDNENV